MRWGFCCDRLASAIIPPPATPAPNTVETVPNTLYLPLIFKQTQPTNLPPSGSPTQTVGEITTAGGRLAIPGDRLRLTFAPRAVRAPMMVTITHSDLTPARTRSDYRYTPLGNLTQKANMGTMLYTDAAHIHAVKNAGGNSYQYDANGNMLIHTENGVPYTQTFNAKNKLASVTWGNHGVSVTYDGDGNRLLKTEDGVTTIYIGGVYERTGTAKIKYYYFGGEQVCPECNRRVAMRQGSDVKYFHTDHLGSAALTTDDSGAVKHQIRYTPYGSERWHSGADVSDYDYTGQRRDSFGLLDYNARYYDPAIGRFISADSVAPNYTNPQDLNRYAYVRGNPVHRKRISTIVKGLATPNQYERYRKLLQQCPN